MSEPRPETHRTLRNLEVIADATGGRLADAVKITAYLADESHFEIQPAYAKFFAADPPARTTVVVGLRQVKVEIDAVLYLGPP